MPASLKKVEEEAKALSPADRASLVQTILESLQADDPEVAQAWAQEVSRRVDAFNRGDLTTYPAEDVFAEARRATR